MSTQTISPSDFTTKIACTVKPGSKILNSTLGANKVTETHLPNPFNISVKKDQNFPIFYFSFNVYIDANNTSPLTFMVNKSSTEFCLEYDHSEETPDYVYEYTITASYNCNTLAVNDQITLYLMDTDPITSSGKKTTVQPST
ncbi:hypothetical protein [uncultured Dokdonia sp.]|uniref:hypothetical protein n=1 Tax=uncultured Dokdonia sp. TaxID=575653 RepID=UPI00261E7E7D|nr:hypothetical protein [uncultured Dokdonia sp.]